MRFFLFALLLAGLLGSHTAHAQAPGSLGPATPASPAVAIVPSVAGPDTATALHRYFARRRHNGHVALGEGVGILGLGGLVLAANSQAHGEGALAYVFFAALSVVASVPLTARGIVLMATHTPTRERRIVQAWQQHRLPGRLARRALNPALTWDESRR